MERRHRRHTSTSSRRAAVTTTVAWQRERLLAMLHEADVHPGEHEKILDDLEAGRAARVLEAYDEVPGVLDDLREPRPGPGHLLQLGLGPRARHRRGRPGRALRHGGVVGVGGRAQAPPADLPLPARAGRPRSARRAVRRRHLGTRRGGPARGGHAPAYLERDGHWPDATRPAETSARPGCAHPRPHRDPAAPRTGLRGAGPFSRAGGVMRQTTRTFCASSPLRPGPTSNSTRWPSSRVR